MSLEIPTWINAREFVLTDDEYRLEARADTENQVHLLWQRNFHSSPVQAAPIKITLPRAVAMHIAQAAKAEEHDEMETKVHGWNIGIHPWFDTYTIVCESPDELFAAHTVFTIHREEDDWSLTTSVNDQIVHEIHFPNEAYLPFWQSVTDLA